MQVQFNSDSSVMGTANVAEREAIATMLALAAGELSEDELAHWFGEHIAAS